MYSEVNTLQQMGMISMHQFVCRWHYTNKIDLILLQFQKLSYKSLFLIVTVKTNLQQSHCLCTNDQSEFRLHSQFSSSYCRALGKVDLEYTLSMFEIRLFIDLNYHTNILLISYFLNLKSVGFCPIPQSLEVWCFLLWLVLFKNLQLRGTTHDSSPLSNSNLPIGNRTSKVIVLSWNSMTFLECLIEKL